MYKNYRLYEANTENRIIISQKCTFRAFRNFAVPLCAIVPRQSTSSWRVIPIPESLHIPYTTKVSTFMIDRQNRKTIKKVNRLWCSRYGNNAIIFIGLNANIKINSILQNLRLSNTKKPQLIQGVTCIAVSSNWKNVSSKYR